MSEGVRPRDGAAVVAAECDGCGRRHVEVVDWLVSEAGRRQIAEFDDALTQLRAVVNPARRRRG